jgi:hypothetical protein
MTRVRSELVKAERASKRDHAGNEVEAQIPAVSAAAEGSLPERKRVPVSGVWLRLARA